MAHQKTQNPLALALLVETRFIPLDGELPALSNCEDEPAFSTPLQYYRNHEPKGGTEDVFREGVCDCRQRTGGGGEKEAGKEKAGTWGEFLQQWRLD